jgi:hypothetical protein
MATTTATLTLTSSDLLGDALSLSQTMSLYQHGTTATGLDEITLSRHNIPTGTNFDLIPESAALSEDASYEPIGRLYAGDWLFMPWDCDLTAAANDSSIECEAVGAEQIVEYALFHNGETLATASDS